MSHWSETMYGGRGGLGSKVRGEERGAARAGYALYQIMTILGGEMDRGSE